MVRWKLRPNSNCPYCSSTLEDNFHITHCSDTKAKKKWKQSLLQMLRALLRIDTCQYVLAIIKAELISERFQTQYIPITSYPPELQQAVKEQRDIGWYQLTQGLISSAWIEYQQKYYERKHSRRKGQVWGYKALKIIWHFTFSIWEARNEQLQQTQVSQELSGQKEVLIGIRKELDIGIGHLLAIEFSSLFSESYTVLEKKSLESQSTWLAIVRNGRFLHKDPALFHDSFSIDPCLNKWLGLIYILKDGQLQSTIRNVQ